MGSKNIKNWAQIKDEQFGIIGTQRRDELVRDFEAFKIGIQVREARENKKMTQEELGVRVSKKRTFISRIENDGSNMTLRTLYDIVEKGLGGKVRIHIEI